MTNRRPAAPKRPHRLFTHGDTRIDPWFWLRDVDDPETLEYLRAENAHTEAVMGPEAELRERLFQEMRGRIKEDDSTVPEREGAYFYYTRFEEGNQYPIHCRKYRSLDAPEEILINVNDLAKDRDYCRVGRWENSPDHKWLAYSVDTDGSEEYTIFIKNLETGDLLAETIPNSYYSLEWANDSQTIFYDVLDENHRPVKIFKHRLGDDPSADELLYRELDERFFVHVSKSASNRFIYIAATGNNMSEWHFMEAANPGSELTLIQARYENFEYDVADHGDRFLIRNNGDGARDFKISETPISVPAWENWHDLVPHLLGRPIGGITVVQDYLILSQRTNGLPQIQIIEHTTGTAFEIAFEAEDYSVTIQEGREWNTSILRFSYTSLTTPFTVYDYNITTRERELRKQTEVLGEFSEEKYQTGRIFAPAEDGTLIPISLLYAKETPLDGSAPLYLYGYGSYGIIIDSNFSSARLSLVDRGYIFAVAHVRGGMDLGWDWYEDGKLLNKRNTFTDFIACAEHLIAENFTAKGRIVASGGSAGGMLVGAVVNLRPDLFKTVIADVPFVDVLNTMLDDTLPLTTMEYNEWGNPQVQQFYDYIKSYSPYDNVKCQDYPHMLITGGISDPRVTYWEPAKWTANLQDSKTDDNLLLLKIHMDSGHAGTSGRFNRLKEVALEYAFILKVFGLSDTLH
ncbi:MAG: oligopeptidase B [SAR202 cluster bacterium Io17-Chloro-G6]|nr:MAG: oligopeptidase B [SAR202 cluster bacterium Io17-Chloro-G6]